MINFPLALALVEPGPAWIAERLARPDRAPLPEVPDFDWDKPRAVARAYDHMAYLDTAGDVPQVGNRDDHVFRFLARMHGLGISQDRALVLYDEFLLTSGGLAPDGWPDDRKTLDKLRRIWGRISADNPPGSELPTTAAEVFAGVVEEEGDALLSPAEKRWRPLRMSELVVQPPVEMWDAEKTIPRHRNGGVGMTYGPGGHHKTNVWISRAFELWALPEPPRIVFANGEGAQGLGARFNAQCIARGLDPKAYHDLFLATEVPLIGSDADMRGYAEFLLSVDGGFRPNIVVIDTFATALAGMDEDHKAAALLTSTGLVGVFARTLKCLVVVVHHTGKDRKSWRGGVGFGWNTDMVNTVAAPDDGSKEAVRWHVERMKDGPEHHSLYYAIENVQGVPVPRRTSLRGYELLTKDATWEVGSIAGALQRLGGEASSLSVVMELHPRGDMDPEDWQARCTALALKLERTARKDGPHLSHLWEDRGGVTVWRSPPLVVVSA